MPGDRFEPRHNFEAGIKRQPEFKAGMGERTEAVFVAVRAQAPEATGAYKRSLRRRGNRILATDFFWFLVEYGSRNNPTYAPLRRGVLAAGLRFRPNDRPTGEIVGRGLAAARESSNSNS